MDITVDTLRTQDKQQVASYRHSNLSKFNEGKWIKLPCIFLVYTQEHMMTIIIDDVIMHSIYSLR